MNATSRFPITVLVKSEKDLNEKSRNKQDYYRFILMMKKLKVIVERTSTGYSAYAQDHEVYTVGGDVQELISNIIEAFNFHFEDDGGNKTRTITRKDLNLSFSIPSLFQLYPINVKHFAQRVGMNYTLLSQYVQGRKQPSEKQTQRIVKALQEIGKELSEVRLI